MSTNNWLALDKPGSMRWYDSGEFRVYYWWNPERAMIEKTRQFFRHVLYENQSVRDFLDSDYSFGNAALAIIATDRFASSTGTMRGLEMTCEKRVGSLMQFSLEELLSLCHPAQRSSDVLV